MRVRHRIPSIFNLSMVDALCCALGCIILLWLVNARSAKRQTEELSDTRLSLERARSELTTTNEQLESAHSRLIYLAATEQERDETRKRLAAALDDLSGLHRQFTAAQDALQSTKSSARASAAQLAEKEKAVVALGNDLKAAQARVTEQADAAMALDRRLAAARSRADKLQELADQVPGLRDKLTEQETRAQKAEKEMARRTSELDSARQDSRDRVARAEADLEKTRQESERLRKDLQSATRTVEELQGDKKALRAEADRIRTAADNRFAGMTLTGRNVVFLVDMSGSMELVDENTEAPEKWRGVREAVSKILRSLPDVEKFQVIVFSDRVRFPLGNDAQWLPYDSRTSADRATEALAQIKPHGGTDMHAGMETAFRFRDLGLDTIYLLSDGLPNMGPGLTQEQMRLNEAQQGEILGKFIRRLLKSDWNHERTNQPRVRINTIGFFYESPDVGAFLWALARENNGSFVGMSRP